ncbi:MAG: VWA domain-containing protein, partial [Clostridia bacterium]|nr:VWA domain-containing protein [Clostridia bacterium]
MVGVDFPEYHVNLDEPYDINVTIRSKLDKQALSVELLDNGNAGDEGSVQKLDVSAGLTTVTFSKTFTTQGLHEICVKIIAEDYLQQNNEYYSYIYLEVFDNILILERYEGESDALEALLKEENAGYNIKTMNILTSDDIPTSLDELRKYDQVILNNIANSDLPDGFDEMLYSYVYTYGGGLFTVGGSDEITGEAHAYNRADMRNTVYQQMLPVQAIDYTPPVGVVIIIDISGSMDTDGGNGFTKRELAKQGAIACLEALTERDYVGVMTLDSVYGVVQPMTSTLYKSNIVAAIEGINGTGGTVFSDAISRAGQMLTDLKSVDRRHVIIVTDGVPVDNDEETYLAVTRQNYLNNKITLSIVGIGIQENSTEAQKMETLVDKDHGNGRLHCVQGRPSDIALEMYEDLNVAEIKEVEQKLFNPIVSNELSTLFNGVEYGIDTESRRTMNVQLGGFYGVKVRADEYLILEGQYQVPIYAQWKFGAGSVGSFMCDLSGKWSSDFLADGNGQRFILNVVSNLMPTANIRPNEITAHLVEENYINPR